MIQNLNDPIIDYAAYEDSILKNYLRKCSWADTPFCIYF